MYKVILREWFCTICPLTIKFLYINISVYTFVIINVLYSKYLAVLCIAQLVIQTFYRTALTVLYNKDVYPTSSIL